MTQNKDYTFYVGGNGPPCPSFGSTSLSLDGILAHGAMEEREDEWLERQRVSRHSQGKHNDKERISVLRVTSTLYL